MQIQRTGEIGSTKRKFLLSGVPLIESRLYFRGFPFFPQIRKNLSPRSLSYSPIRENINSFRRNFQRNGV